MVGVLSVSDAPAVRTTVIVDSTDSVDGLPAHWHDFKAKLKTAEPGSGDVDLLADSAWDGTTSEVLAAIKPAIIHRLLLGCLIADNFRLRIVYLQPLYLICIFTVK